MSNTDKVQKVLFIGDLHVSDVYQGSHVDYLQNCFEVLESIDAKIQEIQPTHIVLTGDIVGVDVKVFRLLDTQLWFHHLLLRWNRITNNNVYSNKGNHDFDKRTTSFDYFVAIGSIKHVDHFDADYLRVHLLDYGDHSKDIVLTEDGADVAVTHTNIQIAGKTTHFRSDDAVELSTMKNLKGVQYVIGGHIHQPTFQPLDTTIEGEKITLIYPGNPTRVKREPGIWDNVYLPTFTVTEEKVKLDLHVVELKPAAELFLKPKEGAPDAEDVDVAHDEEKSSFDFEELMSVIDTLSEYNLLGDMSYRDQLKAFGMGDEEAIALAIEYIDKAEHATV